MGDSDEAAHKFKRAHHKGTITSQEGGNNVESEDRRLLISKSIKAEKAPAFKIDVNPAKFPRPQLSICLQTNISQP